VVQAHALLHEAFASQRRVAGFDADRGSSANAVEQFVAVEHRLHPEFGQQLAVEFAGDLEAAHRQDHVCHPVDFDCHGFPHPESVDYISAKSWRAYVSATWSRQGQ